MELLENIIMISAKKILDDQEILANNLANVSTIGFKSILINPTILSNNKFCENDLKLSNKLKDRDPTQGFFRLTKQPLDIAIIDQNGWLMVKTNKNKIAYTKNGHLKTNIKGQLTSQGNIVIGENGPIIIPKYDSIKILSDGTIKNIDSSTKLEEKIDKIKLVKIDFKDLTSNNGLYFLNKEKKTNINSQENSNIKILLETLEDSNVSISENIIKIIEDSRKFDIQMKIFHDYDENVQLVNKFLNINN
ncbi:MAG: flagellar basal body rod C-terminal domain-containing protein [Buchnera aphidicola (Nurudea shiraii)]